MLKKIVDNKNNMSIGPGLIWPNITIGVNAIFEEILALAWVRHIVSSKRGTVLKKCSK